MPAYRPQEIEKKWQAYWQQHQTFRAANDSPKPKYYVLDMFPYPSGAGLHVGHPLGYIASDIVARYQRLQGRNVLHPMGFDSFGLPAEQYAIQTGQHPALTTEQNIETYIRQLQQLGFSYDWEREVRTSDPSYYKWTQWIFLQLFGSWYNLATNRAEPIAALEAHFAAQGSAGVQAAGDDTERPTFSAQEWNGLDEPARMAALLPYRLAYQQDTYVNWCPALGTVLSNDEVKDGLSERGGYPVERRLMPQWNLRITAYADRLLQGLDTLDWPEAVKEMQRNWIGRSVGASVRFKVYLPEPGAGFTVKHEQPEEIEVFTTRVDTIYGATFLVLAPEHPLTLQLGQRAFERNASNVESEATWQNLQRYVEQAKNRSERDRQADTKTISGAFTGFYVRNPFTYEEIPVWTADYVLAGYGTGAVMAVPSGDQRDWLFAKHFNLPIVQISDAQKDLDKQADPTKEGRYVNSGDIDGLTYKEATKELLSSLVARDLGEPKITYRLRDAIFGRQRYWGEPIPIYYKNGTAYPLPESELPLVLPEIDEYRPTETGEPPLGRAKDWKYQGQYEYELSTMPGWAGSSWYYLRYMDPHNAARFVSEAAEEYWGQVDLYMGGAEHATGHLLYSRFWYLFLRDLGLVHSPEPFQKLINQGMILGVSELATRIAGGAPTYNYVENGVDLTWLSINLHGRDGEVVIPGLNPRFYISNDFLTIFDDTTNIDENGKYRVSRRSSYLSQKIYVPIEYTENSILDVERYTSSTDVKDGVFLCRSGYWQFGKFNSYKGYENADKSLSQFKTEAQVEKMSKSKYNVVNPDVLIDKFGADALRLYEMFLGPLEQFKPWNTNGITGVGGFLKKFWRLFHPEDGTLAVTDEPATPAELKVLHRVIQKVAQDVEKFSFNTSVSTFMIAVNELTALGTRKRAILEPLTVLLSPFAPHLTEELWQALGHAESISFARYPEFREEYLVEANVSYPLAINGKVREQREFAAAATAADIEAAVRESDFVARFGEGKAVKKVVVVPGRMVNVVV